jgi:hypothetical protein
MKVRSFVIGIWCACIVSGWAAHERISHFGEGVFPIGEELVYSLKWGRFSVGEGFLRVMPKTEIEGRECYHFMLAVNSNEFADAIYKVRTRIHSYVCAETLQLVQSRIYQHEGPTRRNATVYYDWENMTAVYHRDGREPNDPVEIVNHTWDPLSVLYAFRVIELEDEKGMVSFPATDGRKLISIDIALEGDDNVSTRLGSFESLKTAPNTKDLRGVFEKSKDSKITIWFSNDDFRLPLIIRSRVIVGSFSAILKKRNVLEHTEETEI